MPAAHDVSLRYGRVDGRLIHISEVQRGLACGCACPQCGEPLVARQGDVLVHHFAHATDTTCTPNPETLTHRYAKEIVAVQLKAILPAFEVHQDYQDRFGYRSEAAARQAEGVFEAASAEVECREFSDIIPDVLLRNGHRRLAVEVHFRHAVPNEKLERFRNRYLEAVEVRLDDLPVDCEPAEIREALRIGWRWKWLNNRSNLTGDIHAQLSRCAAVYSPSFQHLKELKCATPQVPVRKLEEAQNLVPAAKKWISQAQLLGKGERLSSYRSASLGLRLAIHCHYLGIDPEELPLALMQRVWGQSLLTEHGMYWQTWVFAKFCVGTRRFTARDVETEARSVLPTLNTIRGTLQSANGFSDATRVFYELLLQLSIQGLVKRVDGEKPWLHQFEPLARTVAEATQLLKNHKPRPTLRVAQRTTISCSPSK